MTEQFRWCAGCDEEQVFVMPPCEDEHGLDCLDLACVACGHAIVVGVLILTPEEHMLVAAA